MDGWIKLYRKIMDNPYYFAEKFCRGMAWVDLLLLANHEAGVFYKRGIKVEVKRGQLGHDVDTLAKRWKWSRGKVERWLFELEKSDQIVRQKNNVTTLITITNYELHQGSDKANSKANDKPNDKADSKANGHEQECKEDKEVKKGISKPSKSADFIDSIIDQFVQAHGSYEIISRGKERAAASAILKKYKEKYPAATTDETIDGLRHYFNACVNISDPWLHDNMSLSIIVSKFNEINNYLRNGKHKGTGVTEHELAEIIARRFGVDAPKG